jgi:hypothetical protein
MGAGASTAEGSELAELQQNEGLAASAAEVERVVATLPADQQADSVEQIVQLVSDCKVDGKSEAQIEEEVLKCCEKMEKACEKCSAQCGEGGGNTRRVRTQRVAAGSAVVDVGAVVPVPAPVAAC